jgi:hypothetical protein
MKPAWRFTFAQVDEGFHGGSKVCGSIGDEELKVTLLFLSGQHKSRVVGGSPRLKPLRKPPACLHRRLSVGVSDAR